MGLKTLGSRYTFTNEGVRADLTTDGVYVMLRRAEFSDGNGHQPFAEEENKFFREKAKGPAGGKVPATAELLKLYARLIPKHLYDGGGQGTDARGKEIPFTREEFAECLKKYPELVDDCLRFVRDRDRYEVTAAVAEEGAAPNSSPASPET